MRRPLHRRSSRPVHVDPLGPDVDLLGRHLADRPDAGVAIAPMVDVDQVLATGESRGPRQSLPTSGSGAASARSRPDSSPTTHAGNLVAVVRVDEAEQGDVGQQDAPSPGRSGRPGIASRSGRRPRGGRGAMSAAVEPLAAPSRRTWTRSPPPAGRRGPRHVEDGVGLRAIEPGVVDLADGVARSIDHVDACSLGVVRLGQPVREGHLGPDRGGRGAALQGRGRGPRGRMKTSRSLVCRSDPGAAAERIRPAEEERDAPLAQGEHRPAVELAGGGVRASRAWPVPGVGLHAIG